MTSRELKDWISVGGRTILIQLGYEGTYHVTVSHGEIFGIATGKDLDVTIREAILDHSRHRCGAI